MIHRMYARGRRPGLRLPGLALGTLGILLALIGFGCEQKDQSLDAEGHVRRYEQAYQAAVKSYQELLAGQKDVEQTRVRLGKLYLGRADFAAAIAEFKQANLPEAKKYLAKAYYAVGDYAAALDVLEGLPALDDESRYDAGLAAEKLNLFDKALAQYRALSAGAFSGPARERIALIEKQSLPRTIKDLAPDIARIIAAAPSAERYPQAGAQILWCDETIRILPDNKAVSQMHYLVKILNERGKEAFSETQIDYDSTYEKVELEFARTIKPDGEVIDVGSRHIRDVSKYLNFPLYSNARVSIISFPEITGGSCIEYKVRIVRNQLLNKQDFVETYLLQSEEPIIAARLSVEMPAGRRLAFKAVNGQYNDFGAVLEPRIEQTKTSTIWRWEFRDIPQIIPEPGMPSLAQTTPALLFSTFAGWEDIYRWWWRLAEDKIRADDAIKALVKQLTAAAKTPLDQVRALYNFCARDIRYVAVEYGQAGYEPHAASDILKNKYGDCKDQAVLLVTMLAEAGFKAWPVLIPTRDIFDLQPDFPAMLFNHAIAAVEFQGRTIYMDPTAQTCSFDDLPPGDQDRAVLSCRPDGWKIAQTPLYSSSHNLIWQSTAITINPDESIVAQKIIKSRGVYDQAQRYWLLYTVPDVVQDQIAARIQDISIGARLKRYKVSNLDNLNKPLELEYEFAGQEYLTAAGALRIMPQLALVDTVGVAKEKRRYPLEMEFPDTKETHWRILLPAGLSVTHIPGSLRQDSPWISFEADFAYQNRMVTMDQRVVLKQRIIPQEEYPRFKAFIETLARQLKQRVVLERKR